MVGGGGGGCRVIIKLNSCFSAVTPALKEPLPGWVDNLNGPTGILAAGGKGVLRSVLCNSEYTAEAVPVDFAINAVIVIAWKTAITKQKQVSADLKLRRNNNNNNII